VIICPRNACNLLKRLRHSNGKTPADIASYAATASFRTRAPLCGASSSPGAWSYRARSLFFGDSHSLTHSSCRPFARTGCSCAAFQSVIGCCPADAAGCDRRPPRLRPRALERQRFGDGRRALPSPRTTSVTANARGRRRRRNSPAASTPRLNAGRGASIAGDGPCAIWEVTLCQAETVSDKRSAVTLFCQRLTLPRQSFNDACGLSIWGDVFLKGNSKEGRERLAFPVIGIKSL
jgi:hypothetical protein